MLFLGFWVHNAIECGPTPPYIRMDCTYTQVFCCTKCYYYILEICSTSDCQSATTQFFPQNTNTPLTTKFSKDFWLPLNLIYNLTNATLDFLSPSTSFLTASLIPPPPIPATFSCLLDFKCSASEPLHLLLPLLGCHSSLNHPSHRLLTLCSSLLELSVMYRFFFKLS